MSVTNLLFDDNFTNSPVSGSRAASYPTSAGSGASSTTGVGNGWIDAQGSTWNLPSSGSLQAIGLGGSPIAQTFVLRRPSGENAADSRIVWSKSSGVDPGYSIHLWLRLDSTGANGYFCYVSGGAIFIGKRVSGSNTNLFANTYTMPTGATATSVDFSVEGTALSATITYTGGTGGDSFKTTGGTDSTFTAAGSYAFGFGNGDGPYTINRLQTYNTGGGPLAAGTLSVTGHTSSSVSLATGAATGGTATYTYKLQRAPDVSGSAGTYADVGSYQSGLTWTDTGLSSSTTYWYRVISKDAVAATVTGNAVSQATDAPPSLSLTSFTVTPGRTSNGLATVATGGTTPYTYSYTRSTTANGTFTSTGLSGASATDTGLTYRSRYYYKVTVTDSAGTPATVTSGVTIGYTFPPHSVGICMYGDSITSQQGTHGAAATLLNGYLNDSVSQLFSLASNVQGQPGFTTADLTPASSTVDFYGGGLNAFNTAVAAANTAFSGKDVKYVHIMAGMNDVNGGTTTTYSSYLSSMTAIVAGWVSAGYKVILSAPYPPGLGFASPLPRVDLAWSYRAALDSLVDNVDVFAGDRDAFLVFGNQPSLLQSDFLHPTTASGGGNDVLTKLWADAITRVLMLLLMAVPVAYAATAGAATPSYAGSNVPPARTVAYGPTAQAAVSAYAGTSTAPGANSATYLAAAQPALAAYSGTATIPARTAAYAPVASPAVASYSGANTPPARTGGYSPVAAAAQVSYAGNASAPASPTAAYSAVASVAHASYSATTTGGPAIAGVLGSVARPATASYSAHVPVDDVFRFPDPNLTYFKIL